MLHSDAESDKEKQRGTKNFTKPRWLLAPRASWGAVESEQSRAHNIEQRDIETNVRGPPRRCGRRGALPLLGRARRFRRSGISSACRRSTWSSCLRWRCRGDHCRGLSLSGSECRSFHLKSLALFCRLEYYAKAPILDGLNDNRDRHRDEHDREHHRAETDARRRHRESLGGTRDLYPTWRGVIG
jgi:hypothetical protein